MQRVFVLDKKKQPLMPCTPARARKLLSKQGIRYRDCRLLQQKDGYQYSNLYDKITNHKTTKVSIPPRAEARGFQDTQ